MDELDRLREETREEHAGSLLKIRPAMSRCQEPLHVRENGFPLSSLVHAHDSRGHDIYICQACCQKYYTWRRRARL